MKKINKSKVIIPALAMIALSTAASATGTVAWFAANGTVTASTMTFKAVAGANLYIAKGSDAALSSLTGTSVTDLDVDVSTAGISPCTMKASGDTAPYSAPVTVQDAATYTTAPTVGSAGTAASFTDIATVTSTAVTNKTDKDCTKYAAIGFVTIARKQTNASTFKLTPKVDITFKNSSNEATANKLNKCIRAGLILNDKFYESADFVTTDNATSGTYTWAAITGLNDNTAYPAALMIWYEGSDADCISNNAIDVTKNEATWTFTDTISQA